MKRIHIFLLIVTAILGFISCDIRSEYITPLNYSDTLYVYHKDTVYISNVDTLYLDCNCGGNTGGDNQNPPSEPEKPEEPEKPAVPVETRIITVDMTAENPFTEDLRGSQTAEYVEYTLVEGGYKFGFYNAYKSGSNIRLTGVANVLGYVKFPAIDGYKLTNITIKCTATNKHFTIYKGDPTTDDKQNITGFTLTNGQEYSEDVSEKTEAGVGYYMSAVHQNAQFSKLVLTYGKFE